jgi:hypothetical protein
MSPLEFILGNWMLVVIGGVVLFFLAAVVLEYDSERSASEVGRGVGDRSKRAIGGAAGATAGITVGILGGLYEAGMSFADVLDLFGDWFASSPETFSGLFVALLGWLNISGWLSWSGPAFLGLALVLLGIGAIAGMRRTGGRA